jgi:hypothetical protein
MNSYPDVTANDARKESNFNFHARKLRQSSSSILHNVSRDDYNGYYQLKISPDQYLDFSVILS